MRSANNQPGRLQRERWPRWLTVIIGIGVVVVAAYVIFVITLAHAISPSRPVFTSDDANRLAITRFRNYQAGGRAVRIDVPIPGGGLVVTGSVDFRAKIGYAAVRGFGRDSSSGGLIEWSATTALFLPMANAPVLAPASPPAAGWVGRPLQKSGSSLDSALTIALRLGSDRPDNVELLAQNGADVIGQFQVNDHQVITMRGPNARSGSGLAVGSDATGSVTYSIGSDGTMYEVRAGLASGGPVIFDFANQPYVPLQPLPGLSTTR